MQDIQQQTVWIWYYDNNSFYLYQNITEEEKLIHQIIKFPNTNSKNLRECTNYHTLYHLNINQCRSQDEHTEIYTYSSIVDTTYIQIATMQKTNKITLQNSIS